MTEAVTRWGKPSSIIAKRKELSLQAVDMLAVLLSSIFIAIVLGTLFSLVYPKVEIDFSLAALFVLVSMLIAVAIRGLWKAIWRNRR